MRSRKLLAIGLAVVGFTAAASAATHQKPRPALPAAPLLDGDGRAAPGNVIGKGGGPKPRPDGGSPW